jgi:hypothetical protein
MTIHMLKALLGSIALAATLHAGNTFMLATDVVTNVPGGTVDLWVRLFATQRYTAPTPLPGATVFFAVGGGILDIYGKVAEFPDRPDWRPVVTDKDGYARTTYYISPEENAKARFEISPTHSAELLWRAEFPGTDTYSAFKTQGGIDLIYQPPTTPTELEAIGATHERVTLHWRDNSNNELGFVVARRDGGAGPYFEIASLPTNSVTFVDRRVSPGGAYSYYVTAIGNGGNTQSSPIRVVVPTVPLSPVSLKQPANSSKNLGLPVKFVWNTVPRAAVYEIEIAESNPLNVKVRATKSAQATLVGTYTTSSLSRGRTYFWRVRALDATGQAGRWSDHWSLTIRR